MSKPIPICIFVKDFVADQVKTRLIPSIGSEAAAALAKAMFLDTRNLVRAMSWAQEIIVSIALLPNELVMGCHNNWLQGEGNLGERLERNLRKALLQADAAIAIGTDSPGLPPELLKQARTALKSSDAVLGPCHDGGFYLVGLRKCPSELFAEIGWSREDTLSQTVERFRRLGLNTTLIGNWFDIDHPDDLKQFRNLIASGQISAPNTVAALEKIQDLKQEIFSATTPTQ